MKPQDNRYYWVLEPFLNEPSLILKSMFGCSACYLHGKLVLVLADDKDPWKGLLVPTEKKFQPELIREIPALKPHSVLGKWLYLSADGDDFEELSMKITEMITRLDPRIGVEPKEKAKKGKR